MRIPPSEVARLLQEHGQRVKRAIAVGAQRGAQRGRSIIVRETPVDQGQLRNSWKVSNGGQDSVAELYNDAPHAGIVEAGARPHPVSEEGREALYQWVRRNRASFGFATKSGRAKKVTEQIEQQMRAIAEGIARKLRAKGQEPTHFVKKSLPALTEAARDEIMPLIERELQRGQ